MGDHRLCRWCAAVLLLSLSVAHGSQPVQQTCYPSDFERVASACDASSGMRTVRYLQSRNCSSPFSLARDYSEPCTCTPQDYMADYTFDNRTKICQLVYVPTNCTEGTPSEPVIVDTIFCEVEHSACTEDNIRNAYLQCDPATKAVEVVYYFDNTCNPQAPGSVRLPPNSYIPCDLHCEAGTVLSGQACQQCPNGTFSMGGGMRLEGFTEVDPTIFKTSCAYKSANGTSKCTSWQAEGGSLKVGPFDQPNEYFQDECVADPSLNCHNSLRAILTMNIKLVRDGYVKFSYTVSAERAYDGLAFYIDDSNDPSLPMDSYEFGVTETKFSLAAGYHELAWVYIKDEKWTRGKDSAAITMIEVDGTDLNDQGCTACPAGFYSGAGASICAPCPPDTFSNATGTAQCEACPEGFYSQNEPRTNCTIRPACDLAKDATISYGPCVASKGTRAKRYTWLQPQICQPTSDSQLPAPVEIACASCPAGQVAVDNKGDDTRTCQQCPQGQARALADKACHACAAGQAAVRELSLAHFSMLNGELPPGFHTGCSGQCGSEGWRAVNEVFDSGSGHGNTVSVWLSLNVSLEMAGEVSYNYSVDIPPQDTQRGLFFYVDDNLVDDVQEADYDEEGSFGLQPQQSGPWPLARGPHSLMWVFVKLNADPDIATRDSTMLYEITVRGETRGGSDECETIPEGAEATPGGTAWVECPPGMFSTGGAGSCTPCPANTFNPTAMGGPNACRPCGAGTSSLPNSTQCLIGDASTPASFCTYSLPSPSPSSPPTSDSNSTANEGTPSTLTVYDLSPLDRLHPGYMYGPVYENAAAPDRDDGPMYYVNVCRRVNDNSSCADFRGRPLNTYLCRVFGTSAFDEGHKRPAHSLGDAVTLHPLGGGAQLERRGLLMSFEGEKCPFGAGPRRTNITFVCDPDSGYGQPEAWTTEGQKTVFNPSAPFPWVSRAGAVLPVEQSDFCSYALVWYSAYACPLCGAQDYEAVQVSGCVDDKRTTYRYKDPKVCQSNPLVPLPADIPCSFCTESDFSEETQDCVDSAGRHNTTYRWNQPQTCNPLHPRSARLPESILAGPCNQNVTVVATSPLTKMEMAGIFVGGALLVIVTILSIVVYLRSLRIYSEYARLLNSERPGDFQMEEGQVDGPDDDDDDMMHSGGSKPGPRR